jgi:hypothetical protein
MITSARIDALPEADDCYGWITALHAPVPPEYSIGWC